LRFSLLAGVFLAALSLSAAPKPNVVLLYIDDWAWNGSPVPMHPDMPNSKMPVVQMPNVERLAREGMVFQNAYGSPQCSPARACILTGQTSARNKFTVYMNPRDDTYYDTSRQYEGFPAVACVANKSMQPESTFGIPKALAPFGYVSAHIGKWHMRSDPGEHGYVLHDGDTNNNPGNTIKEGLKEGERQPTRLTEELMEDPKLMFSITEKAVGFMEDQVKAGKPFYVQLSHYAMHAGSECKVATRRKYVNHPLVQQWYKEHNKTAETVRRKEDPAVWLGMADDLDGRIGVVLEKLEELGIADNTYVIMVADNGYRHKFLPGLTQPLHAHKWWVWEGGIRVPMIVRGPGIKGGTRFEGNVVNYDLLPTFVEWAGGDPKKLKDIDGVSLASYMAGGKPDEAFLNRNLYFHYPHYRSTMPHTAVVSGSHKVLHFWERPDIPMLFDLSMDIGEVHNIAPAKPGRHKKLFDEMMHYLKQVDARIPKRNPDYDPAKYKADKGYEDRMNWGPFEESRALDEDEI
jgi:arylsulfatase A